MYSIYMYTRYTIYILDATYRLRWVVNKFIEPRSECVSVCVAGDV